MRDTALPGIAVGFFDGVHRGHQAILAQAETALTFRNHPLSVLCPERAPRLIMAYAEREAAIRACGVREVIALEFTRELAAMEPDEFIRRYLRGHVFCGDNWRFGRGGRGDAKLLRSRGLEVTTVPYASYEGEPVSSTRIRTALESARLEAAAAMLGRPFAISAVPVAGKGEGRKLGFPTVNLEPQFLELQLPRGVYAVEVRGQPGIANYGIAPSFGERAWPKPMVEVHFPEQSPPTLGTEAVEVVLKRFLRPERVFTNLDDLRAQIAADCAEIR